MNTFNKKSNSKNTKIINLAKQIYVKSAGILPAEMEARKALDKAKVFYDTVEKQFKTVKK